MIIENDEEHGLVLKEIERLVGREGPVAVIDNDWCNVLTTAAENYEEKRWPLPEPTMEEAAKFRSDENPPTTPGLKRFVLVEHQGSAAARKVLDHLWLTPEQAAQMNRDFHASNMRVYPEEETK